MRLADRLWGKLLEFMLMNGQGFVVLMTRAWWNPVSWFLGRTYIKRVPPEDFWRKVP